ncbi:MAG: hypothetical protein ACPKQO_09575 [Nitrososphaeraceae archaeon]
MTISNRIHKIYLKHEKIPFYVGDKQVRDHYVPIGNDYFCEDFSLYFTNIVPEEGGRFYIDRCFGHLILSCDSGESKPVPRYVKFCPFCGEEIKLVIT